MAQVTMDSNEYLEMVMAKNRYEELHTLLTDVQLHVDPESYAKVRLMVPMNILPNYLQQENTNKAIELLRGNQAALILLAWDKKQYLNSEFSFSEYQFNQELDLSKVLKKEWEAAVAIVEEHQEDIIDYVNTLLSKQEDEDNE